MLEDFIKSFLIGMFLLSLSEGNRQINGDHVGSFGIYFMSFFWDQASCVKVFWEKEKCIGLSGRRALLQKVEED